MFLKKTILSINVLLLFLLVFSINTASAQRDSVFVMKYNKILYYNSDSIFYKYNSEGFLKTINEIYYYYTEIVPFLTEERQSAEIQKIRSAANGYDCENLRHEADFMEAFFLPDSLKKEQKIQQIIQSASERNDISMKIRGMEALFDFYWASMNYAKAFQQTRLLDDELQKVSDEFFPRKNYIYCSIGKAYYFFRNYDVAIPYLRKALVQPKYYFDTSNLDARNTIGTYFKTIGQVDSAEHYFRTALYSTEHVKDRLMLDAFSLSNIGLCIAKRNEYSKAASYLEPALSRMLIDYNYELASRVAVNLGDFYFIQNRLKDAKHMIDSSRVYIKRSNNTDLYSQLYFLMCKYYLRVGQADLANSYLDSAIIATKNHEEKYSGLNILLAEQELFEAEKALKDDYIKRSEKDYRTKLFYSFVALGLIALALLFVFVLYRKNKMAYRALVLKAQDWAEITPKQEQLVEEDELPEEEQKQKDTLPCKTEEDETLEMKAREFLTKDKAFNDIDLTLDSLAKDLNINRNYLSKAINRVTGKNFNTYINEFRVKEAIKMMSDEKMNLLSIDAIALEVGFGNRISFYQAFKKMTGLSPSDFRKNKD